MTASILPIAVIGMACRVPGAGDVESFWQMLLEGRQGVSRLDRAALLEAGEAADAVDHPDYVAAYGHLDDAHCFDAAYFGIAAAEAALMDPQIRVGLECAQAAFDAAGQAPGPELGRVGVYVGASLSTYLLPALQYRDALSARHGGLRLLMASDKDHLAGQIAFRLDLRGPAMAVGTACASSLVAVDLACRALATGDVGVALAGGVSIHFPQRRGYRHEPGGIYARDGHCRAFAADAAGVTPGAGAAMLLLKPLQRAIEDGDVVHAVIRGSAVSGDGADKVGYTAPSEQGQVRAIELAWLRAGLQPGAAGLIEGHGTGTPLGDAIEIAALQRALPGADCAIGSVKSNVGHLDAAAGALSLIKAVKAVETGYIPASLNVLRPNPALEGPQARFRVPASTERWEGTRPRVAGVSSFGIGGVNAHVVVSEPPARSAPPAPPLEPAVLALAARDAAALRRLARCFASALVAAPQVSLCDLAWTVATRSARYPMRTAARVRSAADARQWLEAVAEGRETAPADPGEGEAGLALAAWLQGDDVPDLARRLCPGPGQRLALPAYPFERRELRLPLSADASVAATPVAAEGSRAPAPPPSSGLAERIDQALRTRLAQRDIPATIDQRPGLADAMNRLAARLVHDVLTTLGAFLPDGRLRDRAALAEGTDPRMVALLDFLLHVAAEERLDGQRPPPSLPALKQQVAAADSGFAAYADFLCDCALQLPRALRNADEGSEAIYGHAGTQRLATLLQDTPQHSEVAAAAQALAQALASWRPDPAAPLRVLEVGAGAGGLTSALLDVLPQAGAELVVSDVSGLFLQQLEERWRDRAGVSFRRLDLTRDPVAQGCAEQHFDVIVALDALHAVADPDAGMLTIRRLLRPGGSVIALETMRPSRWSSLTWGLSPAWWAARVDWRGPLRTPEGWQRFGEARAAGLTLSLLRQVGEAPGSELGVLVLSQPLDGDATGSPADWLYTPAWVPVPAAPAAPAGPVVSEADGLLLLVPEGPGGATLEEALQARCGGQGARWRCLAGDRCERVDARTFRVRPAHPEDYARMFTEFGIPAAVPGQRPLRVLHAFALGADGASGAARRTLGFDGLLALARALAEAVAGHRRVHLGVLSSGVGDVTGDEELDPVASLLDAPVQLIGRELPDVAAFRLDIDPADPAVAERTATQALALLEAPPTHPLLVLRGRRLWREGYERRGGSRPAALAEWLAPASSVLVVGGTGGIGRALVPLLAQAPGVHVAISARRPPVTGSVGAARLGELMREGTIDEELARTLSEVLDAGATLSLHAADVSDAAAMSALVDLIEREHRPLRAVLHAAGEPDLGGVMMRRQGQATASALRAKVEGVEALLDALGDRPLDLLVFCASIGSLLPRLKFGEVAYVAANNALTTAARRLAAQARARKVLALSWTDWRGGGMWVDAQQRLDRQYRVAGGGADMMPDLLRAITPEQGRQAFLRALSLDAAHVVVCAQPLQDLLARHSTFTTQDHASFLESHRLTRRAAAAPADAGTTAGAEVAAPVATPAGPLEDRLAQLWAELLGVKEVNPDDDFFELGGDSLLGIRVLNRLREDFGVDDSLAGLMSATTVRRLADRVRRLRSAKPAGGSFEEMRL
jgi:acyl transferase domain-containing protein/NADP-dependent 3-hydroxy acid dehydrogenase YdfG/acyl carrier protein